MNYLFTKIPIEILSNILLKLDSHSLINFASSCKYYNRENNILLKDVCDNIWVVKFNSLIIKYNLEKIINFYVEKINWGKIYYELEKFINFLESGDLIELLPFYKNKPDWRNNLRIITTENVESFIGHSINRLKRRWLELEPYILKNPKIANRYVLRFFPNGWDKLEQIIITNPNYSVDYAIEILKNKWPDAEPFMLNNPRKAIDYAIVFNLPNWIDLEKKIIETKDINNIVSYAIYVLRKRWKKVEDLILTEPKEAIRYCANLDMKKWHKLEHIIKNNDNLIIEYVERVLEKRWPEIEDYIQQNPNLEYKYISILSKLYDTTQLSSYLKLRPY